MEIIEIQADRIITLSHDDHGSIIAVFDRNKVFFGRKVSQVIGLKWRVRLPSERPIPIIEKEAEIQNGDEYHHMLKDALLMQFYKNKKDSKK